MWKQRRLTISYHQSNPAGSREQEEYNEIQHEGPAEASFTGKGELKEIAGKVSNKPELEGEGKDEKIAGKVQEKIGQVKKVLGK